MKILYVVLTGLLLSMPVLAEEGDASPMTGQVDFNSLQAIYGEPRVMIDIAGPLLKLIAAASKHDPKAQAIMRDLEGVKVKVYNTGGNLEPALEQMSQAKSALEADAWQPIVQVKDEGENVQMFARIEDDKMHGMAVMVVNAKEAVFLNFLGTIDPAEVGKVMQQLPVDVDVDGGQEP